MGVHKLSSYIQQNHHDDVGHDVILNGGDTRLLFVDGNGLMYYLCELYDLDIYFTTRSQIYECVQQFVSMFHGIRLVVIMDGFHAPTKCAQLVNTQQERLCSAISARQCRQWGAKCRFTKSFLPLFMEEHTVSCLRELHECVEVYYSIGENDPVLSRECTKRGGYAVIASDSDNYILPSPGYIPFSTLKVVNDRLHARIVTRSGVSAALNVKDRLLPIFACLMGNDSTRHLDELTRFHRRLMGSNHYSTEQLVKKIASLTQAHNSAEEMLRSGVVPESLAETVRISLKFYSNDEEADEDIDFDVQASVLEMYRCGVVCRQWMSLLVERTMNIPVDLGDAYDLPDLFQMCRRRLYSLSAGTHVVEYRSRANAIYEKQEISCHIDCSEGTPWNVCVGDKFSDEKPKCSTPLAIMLLFLRAYDIPAQFLRATIKMYYAAAAEHHCHSHEKFRHEYEEISNDEIIARHVVMRALNYYKLSEFALGKCQPSVMVENFVCPLCLHMYATDDSDFNNDDDDEVLQWVTSFDASVVSKLIQHQNDDNCGELNDRNLVRALAFVPPRSFWQHVQPLRRAYDSNFVRWMPHLSVVHPVARNDSISEEMLMLSATTRITFDGIGTFFNGSHHSIHVTATVEPADEWSVVCERLRSVFGGGGSMTSQLHLTVARPVSSEDLESVKAIVVKHMSNVLPFTFTVPSCRLNVLVRSESVAEPFRCVYPQDVRPYEPEGFPLVPQTLVRRKCSGEVSIEGHDMLRVNKEWTQHPCYSYEMDKRMWNCAPSTKVEHTTPPTKMRVASLNVLMDTYLSEHIHSDERYARIMVELRQLDADIIGLEEVTRSFLALLLSQEWVRNEYFVSDVDGSTLKSYGQLILARVPFVSHIASPSRNKMMVAAEFPGSAPFVCCCVHLTSSMHGAVVARMNQLKYFYDFVAPLEGVAHTSMIFGDFNFGEQNIDDEHVPNKYVDVWSSLCDKPGFTMDQHRNHMAQITNGKNEPKRIDRFFLHSAVDDRDMRAWRAESMRLFATQEFQSEQCDVMLHPSDHFGIVCELVCEESSNESGVVSLDSISTATNTQDVFEFAINERLIEKLACRETADGNVKREIALQVLQSALNESMIECTVQLLATGSYGLSTHRPESDMDMVLASTMSRSKFFHAIPPALATFDPKRLKVLHVLNDRAATFPIVTLMVDEYIVDLQYCQVPAVLLQRGDLRKSSTFSELERRRLDAVALMALQSLWSNELILDMVPNRERFQQLLSVIVKWAKQRQIYGNRYGYLGGFGWALVVAKFCCAHGNRPLKTLLPLFFQTYAKWNWKDNAVVVIDSISYRMERRDAIAVVDLQKPHRNVVRNATKCTRAALVAELRRACECMHDEAALFASASVSDCPAALRLTVSAVYIRDLIEWLGFVESRLAQLMLSLEHRVPDVSARLYPQHYHHESSNYPYSVEFYVGLSLRDKDDLRMTRSERMGELKAVCMDYCSLVCNWEKKRDTMELNVVPLKTASLKNWQHHMPSYVTLFRLGESSVEVVENDDEESNAHDECASSSAASSNTPNLEALAKNAVAPVDTLTPSHKVLSRLRWDSTLDSRDFTVIYEDRFLGMMEKPANMFEVDLSADDFIPYHRIWTIKWTNVIIWDRKQRIDVLALYHP